MTSETPPPGIEETPWVVKVLARVSLGLVWFYEGLAPKIIFLNAHPEQIELVRRSRLFWPTPELTLIALGVAQIIGWAERAAAMLATFGMFALIVLVATARPPMLTDPFGALAKDICLVSCAVTVWLLAPVLARRMKA
jgi:DoxX-like family